MTEIVFPAAFVLLFAVSFVWFRRSRGAVLDRFGAIAERFGGRVEEGPWYLFPRLTLPLEGAEVQLSGMPGGKNRSSRTFAWVGCTAYPDRPITVTRKPPRVGVLERLGRTPLETGDPAFDDAFWLEADDPDAAAALFDDELRRAVVAFDPALRVALRVGVTSAYRAGRMSLDESEPRIEVSIRRLPPTADDLERLLDLTILAHTRLLTLNRRPSTTAVAPT